MLLSRNNEVYVYEGKFEDALRKNKVLLTTYDVSAGIGKRIRKKQKRLQATDKKEGRNGLILLIKASGLSTYKNVVDALDEVTINDVKKYMVVEPFAAEKNFIQRSAGRL